MKYVSVYSTDAEILQAMSAIHLKGRWFEADITYSKGVFYHSLPQPLLYKSDLHPRSDDVICADSRVLSYIPDNSLQSVIFDPPFLFRNRNTQNTDKISARFSCFQSYEEMIEMYRASMKTIHCKLKRNGYLFFKCQDMSDGKFYCTHNQIINDSAEIGFVLRDILIKQRNFKLQADSRQQNFAAKVHCFWLVLKKS